jgi:hypothetical protein
MEIQSSPFEVLLGRSGNPWEIKAGSKTNAAKLVCADAPFLPLLLLKEHYKPMNFV